MKRVESKDTEEAIGEVAKRIADDIDKRTIAQLIKEGKVHGRPHS